MEYKVFLIYYFVLFITKSIKCQIENRNTQQISTQSEDTSNWPIFRTYPTYSTDSLSYCKFYSNADLLYFKSGTQQYVALSLVTCGFNIFNIKDPKNPKIEVNFQIVSGRINRFSFETSRNILWIAHSEGNIYYLQTDQNPFLVKLAFQSNNLVKSIFVDFIPEVKNAILIICFNQIQIFKSNEQQNENYKDVSSLKYYRTIELNNSNDILKIKFINNLLFIASSLSSLQIYQISKIQSTEFSVVYLRNVVSGTAPLIDFQITKKNLIYIQIQLGGIYSYDANDCVLKGDSDSCKNIKQIGLKFFNQRAGITYLTKDENYLITHFSSIGIKIFDISSNIVKNFQTIDSKGDAFSIAFNSDESLMFQTSTLKFSIFSRNKVSIPLDKPNILLHLIQNTEHTFHRTTTAVSPEPDCNYDSKRDLLFVSRQFFGLTVFKKYPQGILKTVVKLEDNLKTYSFSMFKFFSDSTLAYVTKQQNGLGIIDFTIPEKPEYIKDNLKFNQTTTKFWLIECTLKHQMCAISSQLSGMVIIDIKNLKDPQFLSLYSITQTNNFNIYYSCFMKSQTVLFLAVEFFGVHVLDLSQPNKPQLISTLYLNDASAITITSDDKYLIVASYHLGLVIADTSNLKQLKILSKLELYGRYNKLQFMSNQKYLIIPTQEKPSIFLIDIQDKMNPILLQTIKRKTVENLISVCLDPQESEGFITSGRPIIQTNFKNQIIFHKVVYQLKPISGSDQKEFVDIDSNSPLLVGQVVNMRVFPLAIDNAVAIKQAFVYENYVLQPLKSWMTFQPEQNLLLLTILKDALQQNANGIYINTSQQIVFQSFIALDSTSFINSSINITSDLSSKILTECFNQGYLDEIFMVRQDFNYQTAISINFENIFDSKTLVNITSENKTDIIQAIKYVLKHSIVYYPIDLVISPSLTFNLQRKEEYIKSIRDQVTIYVKVAERGGKFVEKSYSGVLSVVSSEQDEIRIEGDISKVNEILSKKIKFSSNESKESMTFSVIIQDGINYDLEQKISYFDAIFISEQSQIKMHDEQSIQSDFSSKFEESSIYIRERFSYQIPAELFLSEDNSQLQYTAKIKSSDGEYNDIPLNHWIQFSEADRIVSGFPSEKEYNDKIELLIKITDKYSSVLQKLVISVSKLPLIYTLQIIVQILGPILGVLGFWKYKFVIYNHAYKKKYTYSKETIYTGECYQKQILLNNWNIEVSNKILQYFKQLISNKEIANQILLYQSTLMKQQNNNYDPFVLRINNEEPPLIKQDTLQNQESQVQRNETEFKDEIVESTFQSPIYKNIKFSSHFGNNLDQKHLRQTSQPDYLKDEKIFLQFETRNESEADDLNKVFHNSISQNKNNQLQEDSKIQQTPTHYQSQQIEQSFSQERKRFSKIEGSFELKNSTKKFKKQLSQKLQRLSKSQQLQSEFAKQKSKLDTSQRLNSQNCQELWILCSNGNINYSNIINHLILQHQNTKYKNKIFTDEVVQHLNNQSSLLRKTFESFLAEYILQQDTFSYNIFRDLYNKAQSPLENPQWYMQFCKITPNISNIHDDPVPTVTFKDSVVEFEIKSIIFGQNIQQIDAKTLKNIPFSLNLVKETIKAYTLGFISNSVKLKPLSSGESLYIENYNIKQITSFSQKIDNLLSDTRRKMKYTCKKKYNQEFIEKPLIDNFKLPSWIKSVEIINNNFLIMGYPEQKDIDKKNYIARAYEIEVVGQKDNHMKDNQEVQLAFTKQVSNENINRSINFRLADYNDNIKMQEKDIFEKDERQPHRNTFTF